MGFRAKDVVPTLDFDFRPFLDVHGVSPEPSRKQVRHFQREIRRVFGLSDDMDDEKQASVQILKFMASLSEEQMSEHDEELAQVYGEVCSEKPTAEQILELPHRQQQAYIGYLTGELLNPTAGTSQSSTSS